MCVCTVKGVYVYGGEFCYRWVMFISVAWDAMVVVGQLD